MRIISGLYKGHKLQTPDNNAIRPTSDKVRGAIFNTLFQYTDFTDLTVIDGFCGTGALGLEALSRGAAHCLFIDKAKDSLNLTRQNAEKLKAPKESAAFLNADITALKTIKQSAPAQLLFLDPPYNQDLAPKALQALTQLNALAENALCVIETDKNKSPIWPADFAPLDQRTYGATALHYLRYNAAKQSS